MLSLQCRACGVALQSNEFNGVIQDYEDLCSFCLEEAGIWCNNNYKEPVEAIQIIGQDADAANPGGTDAYI